jgi:SAM-dependent methyltransferase
MVGLESRVELIAPILVVSRRCLARNLCNGALLIVCPDCSHELSDLFSLRCVSCGWTSSPVDGIPSFFRTSESINPTANSYQENYDALAEQDLANSIVDERFIQNLAKNLVRRAGNVSGLDICDVGSGKGFAARLLAAGGARSIVAVDITAAYLRTLSGINGIQPVLANAETLPFRAHFDVIISTDVMEHVLNLGSFLFSVNRALKAGGRFIVRVPYRESLLPYSPHFGCPFSFVHLRTFNRCSLNECLMQAGFRVRKNHLDGFFWGKPQPFWFSRRNQWLSKHATGTYYWIRDFVTNRGVAHADITLHNPYLLLPFMLPSTIIADAEKIDELPSSLLKGKQYLVAAK